MVEEILLKNKRQGTALSRFWRYKWSGPMVFAPVIALAVIGYLYMDSTQEFFSPWSCETIFDYMQNIDVPGDIVSHNEIAQEQHIKLHQIVKECQSVESFSDKIPHDMIP